MISPTAKTPMAMTTKLIPSIKSEIFKVKRCKARIDISAYTPSNRPRNNHGERLEGVAGARSVATIRHIPISEKYSGEVNFRAIMAIGGANREMSSVQKVPAKKERWLQWRERGLHVPGAPSGSRRRR